MPPGRLSLHNNATRTAVFPAGGTGIPPFSGVVSQASREKLSTHPEALSQNGNSGTEFIRRP